MAGTKKARGLFICPPTQHVGPKQNWVKVVLEDQMWPPGGQIKCNRWVQIRIEVRTTWIQILNQNLRKQIWWVNNRKAVYIVHVYIPTLQGPLYPLYPVNLSYSNGGHGGEIKKSFAFFICPPEISASYRQAFFGGQIKKAKDFFLCPRHFQLWSRTN